MRTSDITLACITDYGGRVRGKGYLSADSEKMAQKGVGLAPTNLMITSFGEIVASPWGSRGDLLMMPDLQTETRIEFDGDRPDEQFVLCSLHNLDGSRWECCPRNWLLAGLERLDEKFGLKLFAAFEHEFHYSGVSQTGGNAYGLEAFRQQGSFLHELMYALANAGIEPEMVMPEYGPGQFEVTNSPALGLEAADRAVRLREITRSIARAQGEKVTFSPVMKAGMVGNGVHIHFSLQTTDGTPASYDAGATHSMSANLASFVAGILKYMPEFLPLTASSAVSYERLQPNRWSASYNNLSKQDREAGIRICPISDKNPEKSFNVEYRACDATANPYLALGALVWAGLEGLENRLVVTGLTETDPNSLTPEDLARLQLERLPASLDQAIEKMDGSSTVQSWMGSEFLAAYLMNKRSELKLLEGLSIDEQVARYVECF